MPDSPDPNLLREARRDLMRGDIAIHASAVMLQMQVAIGFLESRRMPDDFARRALHAAKESMRAALELDMKLAAQCDEDARSAEAAIEFRDARPRRKA